MKRIRIGKDISMRWEITTGGVAIPLEGRDLTVEIKSPMGIVSNIPYGVSGNTLIITYYGTEQKRVGEYSVTLWENKGKPGQNVVDVIRAFELVRTSQEEDDFVGGDLQIESVDLGTENFDILTEGGYRAINIDTLQADALEDSVNIKGKTYSNESFTITLPKANLDSAGVMSADDKQTLQEHSNAISQINAKLDEHTESINAKITTDRIEDGAVTTEKIATSAFDSTLSVSGKIAPADVVGEKLSELEKINGKVIIQTFTDAYQWGKTIDTIPSGTKVKNVGTINVNLYDVRYGSINTEFAPNQEKVLTHDVTCLRSVRDAGEAKISLYEGLINVVGDLSTLQTSNKQNLVSAINEVNAKFTEPIVIPDDSVGYNNLSEELKNEVFTIYEIKGKNLFNPNDENYKIGYLSGNTGYVQPNNTSYFTSGFVAVEPDKTYYCGKIGAVYPNAKFSFALFYDSNKTPIGERLVNQANLVAPTNASYLRVSMDTGALEEMMISEGQQYPYEPYTYLLEKVINTDGVIIGNDKLGDGSVSYNKLDEDLQRKIDSGVITVKPNGMSIRGNLADGEQLELPKNSVVTDKVISFSANISSFSKLIVGHGYTNLDGAYFEIDATNIKDGIAGSTTPHGLIIVNNIQVTIIKKSNGGSKIIIASNGTEKEFSIWNGYGNGTIFAKSEGSVLTNCSLSFMANNIMADTWCFGDSYFSLASNRWVYYLARDGFNHVMLNGYSGASTDKAYKDLTNLLVMNTPKRIVWCMGMNDPDYDGAVGVRWKRIYDQLLPLCTEKNIELVLSTTPTVIGGISADDVSGNNGKFRPHDIKNQIVKSSGYRYIDFENAVGADAQTGLWFGTTQQDIIDKTNNGMLSKDGVHPTIKGAIALYHQALSDCPELCGL